MRNTVADEAKSMSAISSTVIHTSLSGIVTIPPSVILMMPRSKTSFAPTAIHAMRHIKTEDNRWFDINGHSVKIPTVSGLYIQKGKKYLMK